MSSHEMIAIVVFVVFGALLFSGVMFRFALHYRDKFKQLAGQIEKFQVQIAELEREIAEKDIKFLKKTKQSIDECDEDIKK
ncbi:hypothetical protein [Bartonella sp. MM73XJBT]|uniref:hypothetical protein n=1 Tax=Bartonella sp. MM73XJBT TaxID=3019095 RepID=UPI00236272A7|nr:hypothetical protein [Bartonella sp. MM73XJBT]